MQITRHVAEIVCRQEFILKLARAMMMFGGPTHRLQAQIKATANVLDIELSCMYLPDVMLISFDDAGTGTSSIKFIRQGSALDIGKLQEAHELYWEVRSRLFLGDALRPSLNHVLQVIHDNVSVKDASIHLDDLMRRKQLYKDWQIVLFGGACSASICSVSFNGSFVDCLVSFPLGCLLILIQFFAARNELYSNVFEFVVPFPSFTLSNLTYVFQDHCRHGLQLRRRCPRRCPLLLLLRYRLCLCRSYPPWFHRVMWKSGAFVTQHRLGRCARLFCLYLLVIPGIRPSDRRHGLLQTHQS